MTGSFCNIYHFSNIYDFFSVSVVGIDIIVLLCDLEDPEIGGRSPTIFRAIGFLAKSFDARDEQRGMSGDFPEGAIPTRHLPSDDGKGFNIHAPLLEPGDSLIGQVKATPDGGIIDDFVLFHF